jgi:GT2 family glycosyltransferase
MKVSVVIPNYNGEKIIKKNIPELISVLQKFAAKTQKSVEVVINDDGSSDSSLVFLHELAQKKHKGVDMEVIANEKNYGFSTTVNRGVAKATGEVVILLNTDVVPKDGFLEPLLLHFNEGKIFAVGCMDISMENGKEVLRGRGVGRWEKGFLNHRLGDLDQSDTLWVSGGSGAFRKSFWDTLGGLDELMNPFYWEDIDLSYRAQKAGYLTRFERKSLVTHLHEEGAIKKTSTPKRVRITSYRNQYIFAWTNMSDASLILSHILWQPYHLIRACINRDASFLQGFTKALIMLPSIITKRKEVQKYVTVSDNAVIRRLT